MERNINFGNTFFKAPIKHILYVTCLLLFISCENKNSKVLKNADGHLSLVFEKQSSSIFFSDRIFKKIEITPLETADDCLVGEDPELLSDDHHYFIRDYQQEFILRFDKSGKFINRIGRRGGGPGEYKAIEDYYIDSKAKVVEVLETYGPILRYKYDGTFISSMKVDGFANSFIKTGDTYWINRGMNHELASDGRLFKVSEDGTVIDRFLPLKTHWPSITEQCFSRSGNIISFKECLSHLVYRIIDDGPVKTTVIDFGKYDIPQYLYSRDFPAAIDALRSKGYASIEKYLENNKFIYIFFRVTQYGKNTDIYNHWLVNKNTGNSVLQKLSHDDPLWVMMENAKVLTDDDKLIFIANAQMFKECIDPFFNNTNLTMASLSEESNPVIVSLQINDF